MFSANAHFWVNYLCKREVCHFSTTGAIGKIMTIYGFSPDWVVWATRIESFQGQVCNMLKKSCTCLLHRTCASTHLSMPCVASD